MGYKQKQSKKATTVKVLPTNTSSEEIRWTGHGDVHLMYVLKLNGWSKYIFSTGFN